MTATQIRAAEITLKKCIPDLSAVEHSGEMTVKSAADELAELNAIAAISKARSSAPVA